MPGLLAQCKRSVLVLGLILVLGACGAPPTPTSLPPTPTPTPPSVSQLLSSKADGLCEASFNPEYAKPVDSKDIQVKPVAVLLKFQSDSISSLGSGLILSSVNTQSGSWSAYTFKQDNLAAAAPLLAKSENEVKGVICIKEKATAVGSYESESGGPGGMAYQYSWDVSLITWPQGRVYASSYFKGAEPPQTLVSVKGPIGALNDGYGTPPVAGMLEWLKSQGAS